MEANGASATSPSNRPICAWFVGDAAHVDFTDVMESLRSGTQLTVISDVNDAASRPAHCLPPALIVIAQSRPGSIGLRQVEALRRRYPLAGVVSLLGSWCEGQSRTGQPIPGVERLYWHEFPIWWRRQRKLRSEGRCADWARPISPDVIARFSRAMLFRESMKSPGLIVLSTPRWETADALADLLRNAGYSIVWQQPGRCSLQVRGAVAGIWEGGQLDDRNAYELAAFCRRLSCDTAPVIALLDFPRRDRVERARQLGAAFVLGKPWVNAELVAAIEQNVERDCARSRNNAISAA